MNIKGYPQYQLYLLTKKLNLNRQKLIPKGCDNRCIYSTIINRAYYSSYLYAEEWLWNKFHFRVKNKRDFPNPREFVTEHKQVRNELSEKGMPKSKGKLFELSKLREKADYHPFDPLSDKEVERAVFLMENIFDELELN